VTTEPVGRIEYEVNDAGKRTGRWRPREGAPIGNRQAKVQAWRKGKMPSEPVEAPRK